MSPLSIGIICFAAMVVLALIGVPICISMLLPAVVGFYLIGGAPMMIQQLSNGIFTQSASYSFAVVPLFTIVGVLAGDTGIASNAYTCAKKWVGKFRGGLLYTTVAANALFGACSGISSAGSIVFSKIAAPELSKAGYDDSISLGCIAASSALSSLIPPSIPIIMTCILTNTSIGTALMASTAGGLALVVIMCVVVWFTARIRPGKIPLPAEEDKHVPWRERLQTLKLLIPIAVLFALILGGSFFGWFTATVGGAIAMMAVVIYALVKRMPLKRIAGSVWQGVEIFAGIFLMILSGQIFSRFVSVTGLAGKMINGIAQVNAPRLLIFLLIIAFYLFIGCFMSCMPVIIITAPVVVPMLTGIGFSEYVIVVCLVLLTELGNITPPVGNGVFSVATVLGESPARIFRGVTPFFLAQLIAVILFAACPATLMWLPMLLGMG